MYQNGYADGGDRKEAGKKHMKHILRIFGAVLLMTLALCVCAHAQPSTCPYDIQLSITYHLLSDPERELYDDMYDAIHAGFFSVNVPSGVTRERAKWMIDFIYEEAPELCALDLWKSDVIGSGSDMHISLKYNMPISTQDDFIRYVEREAAAFSGMKDEDGIRTIYEAVIRRFTYGSVDSEDTQRAYYALKNNTAVCNGYAQTAAMFAHFAGYTCSYVTGYVEHDGNPDAAHAWNVALVNNKFMWFDATWDDGGSVPELEWYGLSGKKMAETHRPIREYEKIVDLKHVFPKGVSSTMYLDVNTNSGYVRGVTDRSGVTVYDSDLGSGEFYTPAMVIWNTRDKEYKARVTYMLDGECGGWSGKSTVQPGSNIAFRTNVRPNWNADGKHEIVWYVNGYCVGVFTWTEK